MNNLSTLEKLRKIRFERVSKKNGDIQVSSINNLNLFIEKEKENLQKEGNSVEITELLIQSALALRAAEVLALREQYKEVSKRDHYKEYLTHISEVFKNLSMNLNFSS